MNPVFPIPILATVSVLAIAWICFAAWRGSCLAPRRIRAVLLGLRLLAVAGVLALMWNPGRWVAPPGSGMRPWLLMVDRSASMAAPADGAQPDGETREQVAGRLVKIARDLAKTGRFPLKVIPFSAAPEAPVEAAVPVANGTRSAVVSSLSQALADGSASGQPPAGILVLSDGRESLTPAASERDGLTLRARSQQIAIHAVPLGGSGPLPDLELLQPRTSQTAFRGQNVKLPFAVVSRALPPMRVVVTLRDEADRELGREEIELGADEQKSGQFSLVAPEISGRLTLDLARVPGELRATNNRSTLNLRVIDAKTRVFLAEGAPYWDSKFLAQLLRQQESMEIQSVHRLSAERYFRIDSGSSDTAETENPIFPATLAELSKFDLIVFGKNVDPFIDEARAQALRSYVRDQGGAVLFARGRATTSASTALEALEPVVWGGEAIQDFRLLPTRDGEAAGLFGQALPAADAAVWKSLPTLKDGRSVAQVKPFTRVLADGAMDQGVSATERFPVLAVRRYGQGVTGLVNCDGLWRWDFFPEARELGNAYEDFWTQLIQWMAAYSEFLPGQDFSLRAPSNRGDSGTPVPLTISYRGAGPTAAPTLELLAPDGGNRTLVPASLADPSGRATWQTSFTPDQPGIWQVRLVDPRESTTPAPNLAYVVPAPAAEDADLSPDPEGLAALAVAAGGELVEPQDFEKFLREAWLREPSPTPASGAVWRSGWNRGWIATLLALVLAGEWFLRRRQGLA